MVDIHGLSNVPPPQPNPGSSLSDQLETLIQAFKSNPNDPQTIQNLQDFIMRNQSFLEQICQNNGWSNSARDPGARYSTFIENTMHLLQLAKQCEQEGKRFPPGLVDSIFDDSTQLHWLLTHQS